MSGGIDSLSDREVQVLRLLARGHDAKSIAATLGLSVHTVNERLRETRRKLGVSSSREAARQLLAAESGDESHKKLGDKSFGVVAQPHRQASSPASAKRRAGLIRPVWTAGGVLIMIVISGALSWGGEAPGGAMAGPRGARMITPTMGALTDEAFPAGETPRGGRVGFRVELDAAGDVTKCAVTRPSGVAVLDQATCKMLRVSAQFEPAVDADGQPTAADYAGEYNWKVASLR